MFQISYDEKKGMVTAITSGEYDATIAKEQMHKVLSLADLPPKVRILRIFRKFTFSLSPTEIKEHFTYVQKQLNNSSIKKCYLAVVTDDPINTALGILYQSNRSEGSCYYTVHVFSTEEAATRWLMEN